MTGTVGSKYLLDTMIVAAYFNQEQVIRNKLNTLAAGSFHVSSITIGELFYGAYNSAQVASNISQIRHFTTLFRVLPVDETTGDYYGQTKRALRAKGRPIPENDVWIAATALQHGLAVVTRDTHFSEVDGLLIENW